MFSNRFFSVFERKRAFVSEKLTPPHDQEHRSAGHIELCVIESRIQLIVLRITFFQECAIHYDTYYRIKQIALLKLCLSFYHILVY